MAPGWQCFQLDFSPADNIADLAPCWGSNLNQFDMGTSSMAEPKFGFHGDSLRLRSFDGGSRCKRHVYVLYNFWVLTISVRRLDDCQERECRSHWVELMYHCQWHQVGNVFSSIYKRELKTWPTWLHVEVPIWINLTWVHHLWLSQNLVSMETHYDYEVLMVEAGAKDMYMSCITSGFSRFLFEDWTTVRKENAGPIE